MRLREPGESRRPRSASRRRSTESSPASTSVPPEHLAPMSLLSSPPRQSGKRGRDTVEVVLPSTTYRFRFQRSSDEPDVVVEHSLAYSVSSSVEWNSRRLNLDASERVRLEKFLLLEVVPLLRTKLRDTCDDKENAGQSTVLPSLRLSGPESSLRLTAAANPAGPDIPTDKNGSDPKKRAFPRTHPRRGADAR